MMPSWRRVLLFHVRGLAVCVGAILNARLAGLGDAASFVCGGVAVLAVGVIWPLRDE